MKKNLVFVLWCFMIFVAGVSFTANLSELIPTNPDYDATWWNVGLAVIFAVFFGSCAKNNK